MKAISAAIGFLASAVALATMVGAPVFIVFSLLQSSAAEAAAVATPAGVVVAIVTASTLG